MRFLAAVTAPFLLLLTGCLSAPLPADLVDVDPIPTPEPLSAGEIARLSNAGITNAVVAELIRTRGLVDRAAVQAPAPRVVYREFFVPLWPSYARGRWRLGLRIGCYWRTAEHEAVPPEPETAAPEPELIDP